jgi:predicted molibdopterin-dependent oxidoreductase YjgC
MHARVPQPYIILSGDDAKKLSVSAGDMVEVTLGNVKVNVTVQIDESASKGAAYLPRHLTQEATPLTVTTGTLTKVAVAVAP